MNVDSLTFWPQERSTGPEMPKVVLASAVHPDKARSPAECDQIRHTDQELNRVSYLKMSHRTKAPAFSFSEPSMFMTLIKYPELLHNMEIVQTATNPSQLETLAKLHRLLLAKTIAGHPHYLHMALCLASPEKAYQLGEAFERGDSGTPNQEAAIFCYRRSPTIMADKKMLAYYMRARTVILPEHEDEASGILQMSDNPRAQQKLALLLLKPRKIMRNPKEALALFEAAGTGKALTYAAFMHAVGYGTQPDTFKAIALLERAQQLPAHSAKAVKRTTEALLDMRVARAATSEHFPDDSQAQLAERHSQALNESIACLSLRTHASLRRPLLLETLHALSTGNIACDPNQLKNLDELAANLPPANQAEKTLHSMLYQRLKQHASQENPLKVSVDDRSTDMCNAPDKQLSRYD